MLTFATTAARLRRELAQVEKTSDDLLLQLNAVQSSILMGRQDTDVSVHTGQEALLRIQRAMAQAISAQTELFRAHEAIAKVGREVMGPEEIYTPPSGLSDDSASPVFATIAA